MIYIANRIDQIHPQRQFRTKTLPESSITTLLKSAHHSSYEHDEWPDHDKGSLREPDLNGIQSGWLLNCRSIQ